MIQRLLLLSVVFFWLSSSSYSQEYSYDGNLTQQDIDQSVLYGAPGDPALLDEDKTYMDQIIVPNDYQATTGCLLVQTRTWNGTTGGQCANGIDGTYTFGYGQTVIAQTQDAIAEALKIADITVVGYRWQWRVKNADTNYVEEQGQSAADPLIVTVTVKDKQGNVLDEREWDYSYYILDWEQKYGMHWYDPFITGDKIDTITLEVEGYDAGYWAGYYGPEFGSAGIYSIMVYDPDPCDQIPVVDPTCPGFIGEAPAEDPAVKQLVIIESTGSIPLSEDELSVLESLEEQQETSEASVDVVTEQEEPSSVDGLSVARNAEANALSDAASTIDNTLSSTNLAMQNDINKSQETSRQSQLQSQQSMDQAMEAAGLEVISNDGSVSTNKILGGSTNVELEIVVDSFEIAALDNAIGDALMNLIKLEQNIIREQTEESNQEEELNEPVSNEQEDELVAAALAGDNSEEAQAALLGFNPNFRAYQQPQMTDADFYKPKDIYAGQENYDNPNARFFNGASDATHREMVRQQYEGN